MLHFHQQNPQRADNNAFLYLKQRRGEGRFKLDHDFIVTFSLTRAGTKIKHELRYKKGRIVRKR